MSDSYDDRYGWREIPWWRFGERRDMRALAATTRPPVDDQERRRWKRDRKRKEYLLFPQRFSLGDSWGVMWREVKDENDELGVWQP